jgi:putative peptidoglycan lipid II flippase
MALVRSFATVGLNTLGSRVTGFIRDILVASMLGTGMVADAFVVAFRMPNLFRSLFAEGAFNSSFTPLFARRLEEGGAPEARRFAGEALSVLLPGVLAFTIAAEIAMPQLMYVIAPGFQDNPEQAALALHFTRIAFPYLIFMTMVALFAGMLNSFGRYGIPAAAPILLNIVQVLAIFILGPRLPTVGHALVWGVIAAGLAQFLAVLWDASRIGAIPRLHWPHLTPDVRRLLVIALPGVVSSGITQINAVIGTMISSLQAGAPAILYYSDRVYQVPLGVIGTAVGVVLLPTLTRKLRGGDPQGASETLNRSLEFTMLMTLPAAVAIAVIPLPITQVLFERGHFHLADSLRTADALIAFASGLPAFVLIKALTPSYYAREDMKTPLRFAAISIAVNIAGSLILYFVIGLPVALAIAIATALAGWANTLQLALTLHARGHFEPDRRLKARLLRMSAASFLMGVALFGAETAFWQDEGMRLAGKVGMVSGFVLGGMAVYGLAALLLGATSFAELGATLGRPKAAKG